VGRRPTGRFPQQGRNYPHPLLSEIHRAGSLHLVVHAVAFGIDDQRFCMMEKPALVIEPLTNWVWQKRTVLESSNDHRGMNTGCGQLGSWPRSWILDFLNL